MKINAILGRGKKKDFWDIYELLHHYTLEQFIRFHTEKYPSQQLMITIPQADTKNVTSRIEAAIIKFRKANATIESRRDTLPDLADVLEFMKKDIKDVLMGKDENELFLIADNFGIRHHNTKQKTEYDQPAWHAWMFYCYLSTIHLCLHLKEKQSKQN